MVNTQRTNTDAHDNLTELKTNSQPEQEDASRYVQHTPAQLNSDQPSIELKNYPFVRFLDLVLLTKGFLELEGQFPLPHNQGLQIVQDRFYHHGPPCEA